jgi:hypothetical protein
LKYKYIKNNHNILFYLKIKEGQRSTEAFLRNFIENHDLEPADTDGDMKDPDVQFLVSREEISTALDEDFSEIINERDYNENCTYVGEYT